MANTYIALFAVADLPSLLIAAAFSRLAARMFSLTIVLYALARFGSPALAGWLSFAAFAPGLLASPIAGAVLDRIGAARAIKVDMAASAALALAILVADLSGWLTAAGLLVLVALFSLTSPLSAAAIRTLLPQLVPVAARDRANALDTAIFALGEVAGPALAGLLFGLAGPMVTLSAIAFFCTMAAAFVSRVRPTALPVGTKGSLLGKSVEAVRIVFSRPTLRGLALAYTSYQLCWGMLFIAVPVVVRQNFAFGTGDFVVGLLWAGVGLAAGFGAVAAGHLQTVERERQVMALGMIITGLAAWSIAAMFGFYGLVVGLIVSGFVAGPIDVGLLTLRQRRIDATELVRVLSASMSINTIGFPVGAAIAGATVGISLPASFALAGLFALLGAAATRSIPARE